MKYIILISLLSIFLNGISQNDDFMIQKIKSHSAPITSLDFNKSGTVLASASKNKDLIFTNTSDWKETKKHDSYFAIDAIKFTGDDELLVSSGKVFRHTNLKNEKLLQYEGSPTYILSIDYSLKNNKIIVGTYNKTVRVWNIETQKITNQLEGHSKNAITAAISKTLPLAASGSIDGSLRIWDLNTSECKFLIERHVKTIYDVEFHPNGKLLLSSSEDKNIRLWNAETGEWLKSYIGHQQGVVQIKFSNDGEHFFSASLDGTVRLWQTRTGKTMYSFVDHGGPVNCIAVDKANKFLATGGTDGNIFIYDVNKKILIVSKYEDEHDAFINSNDIFQARKKGEDKDAYAERTKKANETEMKWIEEKYKTYINELQQIKISDETN